MRLLVVIPFTARDLQLTLTLLDWCSHLGGCSDNPCLLVQDCRLAKDAGKPVFESAAKTFKSVEVITTPHPLQSEVWPAGPNWMFETTLLHLAKTKTPQEPWLWLEPDCVPMREGWLKDLENTYNSVCKRKPYVGQVILPGLPKMPTEMLSGVAIYPPDAHKLMLGPLSQARLRTAFDVSTALHVVPHALHTRLIWNFHGERDLPPSFVRTLGRGHAKNVLPLSAIPPQTVLFHRCKDGSLINLLRGDTDATIPQLWMAWRMNARIEKPGAVVAVSKRSERAPTFYHVCERHTQRSPSDDQRVMTAVKSWLTLYKTGRVVPAHLWEYDYPRSARALGDKRDLPYFKDVIAEGLWRCKRDDDVILWTNDDTVLHPNVVQALSDRLKTSACVGSFRVNFDKVSEADLKNTPTTLAARGEKNGDGSLRIDLGRDLFAWRKSWLVENWLSIPDFLLGELEFDVVMAVMVRRESGVFTDKRNVLQIMPGCEIDRGYVLHEKHERQWTAKEAKDSAAKIHNKRLAIEYYAMNGFPSLISNF